MMSAHGAYCLDTLREGGAGVYPALLFLPEPVRDDIAALWAFHIETGNIAYLVSEPMPGEIRLQWWRDVIAPAEGAERKGEGEANPLARALHNVIERHELPRDGFDRYLQARQFDLYNDPMPDRNTLEAYFGETDSFILQMSAMVLGIEHSNILADACGHGGVAMGLSQRLKLLSRDRALQKTWLPMDLLASVGLSREEWLSQPGQAHEMAVQAMTALANEHFDKALKAVRQLGRDKGAAFLPLVLARADLKGIGKPADLLTREITPSPLSRQFALWKSVLLGF